MPEHAICSPQADATAAGLDAFDAGGNALDAALAAAATLCVTYPHNCALGGDLFALVREPDGTTTSVNASGSAAATADAAALRAAGAPRMPTSGPESITVPGLVAGWEALHGLGAALPWAAALEPAIAHAADGFAVGASLATAVADQAGEIASDPGLRTLLLPGGARVRDGTTLRQPALARTLRVLAAEGARSFYDGAIARRLIAGLRAAGCRIDAADLAGCAPELIAPLRRRCGDLDLVTSPPNSSGVLLLQAMAALRASGATAPLGEDAGLLAALLRLGGEQRDAQLADPRTSPPDLGAWLGAVRIDELVAQARACAAGQSPAAGRGAQARPSGDTVAVVAVDGAGRAVSLVQSLFSSFGALLLEPATGVLMHNRGAFFSLAAGHPNELAPGRRSAHTLMPLLVERDGRLRYVLGTMGGKAHAQIHAQVLLRLEAGLHPRDAVAAPRWVVGGLDLGERDETIRIERDLEPAARAALARAGLRPLPVGVRSEACGHAQAIAVDPADGTLRAGSDPRADGLGVVAGAMAPDR